MQVQIHFWIKFKNEREIRIGQFLQSEFFYGVAGLLSRLVKQADLPERGEIHEKSVEREGATLQKPSLDYSSIQCCQVCKWYNLNLNNIFYLEWPYFSGLKPGYFWQKNVSRKLMFDERIVHNFFQRLLWKAGYFRGTGITPTKIKLGILLFCQNTFCIKVKILAHKYQECVGNVYLIPFPDSLSKFGDIWMTKNYIFWIILSPSSRYDT